MGNDPDSIIAILVKDITTSKCLKRAIFILMLILFQSSMTYYGLDVSDPSRALFVTHLKGCKAKNPTDVKVIWYAFTTDEARAHEVIHLELSTVRMCVTCSALRKMENGVIGPPANMRRNTGVLTPNQPRTDCNIPSQVYLLT